jgi:deoxyribose-phosphate aldolase
MKANNFTASQLAKCFDHTALKPETTANEIKKLALNKNIVYSLFSIGIKKSLA